MQLFRLSCIVTVLITASCMETQTPQQGSINQGQALAATQFEVLTTPQDPCGMNSAFGTGRTATPQFGIVGGRAASQQDLVTRSTVKVLLPGGHCTGTIISPNHVLTAAHCFQIIDEANPRPIRFLPNVSGIALGFGTDGTQNPQVQVSSFLVHPNYEGILGNSQGYSERTFFDVAIVQFEGVLPQGYWPVTIGSSGTEFGPNSNVLVAGYGAYGENDRSRRPLTSVSTRISELNQYREIQLQVNGRGACFGDSGGPTYIFPPDQSCLKLIGSTTGPGRASDFTCEAGSGTMMDISTYRGWIRCSTQQMGNVIGYLSTDSSSSECNSNRIVR